MKPYYKISIYLLLGGTLKTPLGEKYWCEAEDASLKMVEELQSLMYEASIMNDADLQEEMQKALSASLTLIVTFSNLVSKKNFMMQGGSY